MTYTKDYSVVTRPGFVGKLVRLKKGPKAMNHSSLYRTGLQRYSNYSRIGCILVDSLILRLMRTTRGNDRLKYSELGFMVNSLGRLISKTLPWICFSTDLLLFTLNGQCLDRYHTSTSEPEEARYCGATSCMAFALQGKVNKVGSSTTSQIDATRFLPTFSSTCWHL